MKFGEIEFKKLYAESVAARRSVKLPPSWTEAALHAAKMIADGFDQIVLPLASVVTEAYGPALEVGGYDACWDQHSPVRLSGAIPLPADFIPA